MSGQNITVGINSDAWSLYFNVNETLPPGGFMYDILSTLGEYGGFNLNFVMLLNKRESYESTDGFLNDILQFVDIYGASPVADTGTGRSTGFLYTTKVEDFSIVLVTTSDEETKINYVSFLAPFNARYELYFIT